MFRRSPTRVQWVMIGLMAVVYLGLLVWVYPEILGVISQAAEDTYSEWVWDAPAWAFWTVTIFHAVAGFVFVWSAGHFIEGRRRRRRIEEDRRKEE